ncbi:hypothetical protein DMC61_21960 [Amycolatopsis sp. WAC 04169]|nr:hypothetical protein DMC61_21960 [Amycolatopsis sp. WAC 04169]
MTPYATSTPLEVSRIVVSTTPALTDPVFAGHFPGFPLLPGAYLIEFVLRAAVLGRPDAVLAELVDCRLHESVAPGDRLRIELSFSDLFCSAVVTVDGRLTARLRLRYRDGE